MTHIRNAIDDAVKTLEQAGGNVAEIRIESSRLNEYYESQLMPSWFHNVDIVADPDVDAYEVMLEREVRA